jgi:hypothetical protein
VSALASFLSSTRPRAPLVFVPTDTPVSEVLPRLAKALGALEPPLSVQSLHEAMGFARGRGSDDTAALLATHAKVGLVDFTQGSGARPVSPVHTGTRPHGLDCMIASTLPPHTPNSHRPTDFFPPTRCGPARPRGACW